MAFNHSKVSAGEVHDSLNKHCDDIALPTGGENLGGLASQIAAAVKGMDLTNGRGRGR